MKFWELLQSDRDPSSGGRTRLGYVLALAGTVVAVLVRQRLDSVLGDSSQYVTFYLSAALAATVGGFWPGMFATVLGSLAGVWLFVEPRGALGLGSHADQVRLVLFFGMGLLVSLLGNWAETSRRRAAEPLAALRASEERFRSVLESSLDAVYRRDLRTDRYDYLSPVIARVMGISPERMQNLSIGGLVDRVHPEDRERVREAVRSGLEFHKGRVEYRFRMDDGQYRWVADYFTIQTDAAGNAIYRSGFVRDVTEQKQIERIRQQSEQRYRSFVEASAQVVWRTNARGEVDQPIPSWMAYTGQSDEQAAGFGWMNAIDPDDRSRVAKAWHKASETRSLYEVEYHLKRHDGQWRNVLARGVPVLETDGSVREYIGTCIDVTEQRQAEAQLRLQAAALEAAANGMAITDVRGTIIWANQAFAKLTGYPLQECLGRNPRILKSGQQDEAFYKELWQTVARGQVWHGELMNRRKDGTLYTEEQTITPLLNEHGKPTHFIAVKQDVSARKAAEQALTAAKLAAEEASHAKDHFLAVLSHELRTPLTPVTASLSILEDDHRVPADVRSELAMIQRNVELETRLIDDLLDLTRVARGKITLDRRPVPLGTILSQVAEICAADLEARGIHFGMTLRDQPTTVEGDPARLQQVFWNILKNAIKFTPAGGCIGMRLWQEDGFAVAEIADSGRGIDPELLPHIFNAFEQGSREVTRQFGGLGLGLAICKAMVDLHGGSISAQSEGLGRGAAFCVRLPLCAQASTPAHGTPGDPARRVPSGRRSLRVLLVEDHGDTARVMKRFLGTRGHTVTTAGDVASALATARREPFDVLVSDIGLPDGSGLDIVQSLRRDGFTVPAIALSGFGQEEDLRRSRAAGFNEHLVKPVDIRRLEETIGRVVNEGNGATSDG